MLARRLKREVAALWLAYRDPRTPWYARVVAVCVVAYAFSPIDLIPDPIPALADAHETAAARTETKPTNWVAAGVIITLWLLLAGLTLLGIARLMR